MNTVRARLYWGLALTLAGGAGGAARATDCQLTILANDKIQYDTRVLSVDANCPQVELTLRHVGKQQARVLGHDWVLARTADVAALANAGMAAGFERGFLPQGDKRIIAATKIVGGGESTTITISMSKLTPGGEYSFFCSYPGHSPTMRGRFQIGAANALASNRTAAATRAPAKR